MNKVFLGGTCATSTWRDELTKILDINEIDYFNPVVKEWNSECIEIENDQKQNHCNIHLYVITKEMQGVYSIAEVIESAITPDKITVLHVIPEGFGEQALHSLKAVVQMVLKHQGIAYINSDLDATAKTLISINKKTCG